MKKVIFIITLAISASFFGCGEDEDTTLRWDNQSIQDFAAIDWIKGDDPNTYTRWSEETGPSSKSLTNKKSISYLSGKGDGIDSGGGSWQLDLSGSKADGASGVASVLGDVARIEENVDATLVIIGAKKK